MHSYQVSSYSDLWKKASYMKPNIVPVVLVARTVDCMSANKDLDMWDWIFSNYPDPECCEKFIIWPSPTLWNGVIHQSVCLSNFGPKLKRGSRTSNNLKFAGNTCTCVTLPFWGRKEKDQHHTSRMILWSIVHNCHRFSAQCCSISHLLGLCYDYWIHTALYDRHPLDPVMSHNKSKF